MFLTKLHARHWHPRARLLLLCGRRELANQAKGIISSSLRNFTLRSALEPLPKRVMLSLRCCCHCAARYSGVARAQWSSDNCVIPKVQSQLCTPGYPLSCGSDRICAIWALNLSPRRCAAAIALRAVLRALEDRPERLSVIRRSNHATAHFGLRSREVIYVFINGKRICEPGPDSILAHRDVAALANAIRAVLKCTRRG